MTQNFQNERGIISCAPQQLYRCTCAAFAFSKRFKTERTEDFQSKEMGMSQKLRTPNPRKNVVLLYPPVLQDFMFFGGGGWNPEFFGVHPHIVGMKLGSLSEVEILSISSQTWDDHFVGLKSPSFFP